jgi:FkbM family methyltransferase
MDVDAFGSKKISMGFIRKILDLTPYGKKIKEQERQAWQEAQQQMDEELLPKRIQFYKQFIKLNDLVFDVGANVGNRIEAFLSCGAKVVAVEPQPSCNTLLEQKFGANITLEKIGLSNEPGELDMHLATDSTVSTFNTEFIKATKDRFRYSEWTNTIKVPVSTLDILIEKYGTPKFCKIDVEGFELQVLKGLHTPIPYISFEYCVPEMAEQAQKCVAALHELSPAGKFNYSIEETMKWALPDWMNYDSFMQHIQTNAFHQTLFGDIYFKNT